MAQAKRVLSTPRRTASKIKPKRSAVSSVPKSGLEIVRSKNRHGKSAKLHDFAKIDWKPWRRTAGMRPTELMPSPETTDEIGVGCRLAYGVMLRTRKQLIAMHSSLQLEHTDKIMAHLSGTAEWLKATAHMVEIAYLRVLASAAAAHVQGIKFKDVDNEPARGKAVRS
jgi:hypothetical protein